MMSNEQEPIDAEGSADLPPQSRDQLLILNERLRKEVSRLRLEKTELIRQLIEIKVGSRADRETRRAALNLMEDAVNARLAEQRENAERQRVEEELRQANRRKDEFLAMLAHELRNPLAPIRNSLHILRQGSLDPDSIESLHAMFERQVNHMVRLVDDLMEVSRITQGRIELHPEQMELASAVKNAVETCQPLIDASRHQLTISLPDEPLLLNADPVRLAQALANLLNNAAKYTEEGGQIWLTAVREEQEVTLKVRDNGTGIPADMLPKIFDLFTQLDRTYSRAQGGLGIGLSLVRRLVDMHGGSIEAHSEGLGKGSEFVVKLPLLKKPPKRPAGKKEDRPGTLSSLRILVVDDNRDAAVSLSMLLKFLGADVQTVHDGHAALDLISSFRPTVILLDIGMPEMDGYEVASQIRKQQEFEDVTLVAVTGWGQEEDRRRSRAAGFDHHLVKPVDLRALQSLLAALPQTQAT